MNDLGTIITEAANRYSLDVQLFASLIIQESSLDQWAFKYEDGFYNSHLKYRPRDRLLGRVPSPRPTLDDEKRFRSVSWGLTQILGETARELGFEGQYLPELLNPTINIEYGAKYLAQCFKKHKGDRFKSLLAYNGGGDLTYPNKVLARLENHEYEKILS